MTYTPKDIETTARTVYGEARGESFEGKIAVAWVIRNRADTKYRGDSCETVCLKPWQFSCWNPTDPNKAKIEAVDIENESFRQCLLAVAVVLGGLAPDPTDGSRHYHVAGLDVNWAEGQTPAGKIGNHLFYKGIA